MQLLVYLTTRPCSLGSWWVEIWNKFHLHKQLSMFLNAFFWVFKSGSDLWGIKVVTVSYALDRWQYWSWRMKHESMKPAKIYSHWYNGFKVSWSLFIREKVNSLVLFATWSSKALNPYYLTIYSPICKHWPQQGVVYPFIVMTGKCNQNQCPYNHTIFSQHLTRCV